MNTMSSHESHPHASFPGAYGGSSRKERMLVMLLAGALLALLPATATAQTEGTWNVNANGNWSATGSWVGGVIPNGAGDIANFTNDINGTRTVTIDGGMPGSIVTLGVINFGDSNGSNSFVISGGTLVLNNNGSNSQINMGPNGNNNTISSAITIQDPLDVTISDVSNSQGLTINGPISGGTNGSATITLTDLSPATSSTGSLNFLVLQGANTFEGQIVANSGLIRFDGSNTTSYAGAVGVGNETIVLGDGGVDLRDHDFNAANDFTEIFKIEGTGPNGLGALRNSSGTAYLSHLELTWNALVNSQGTIVLERHQDSSTTAGVASVLDFGATNNTLSKIGAADFIIRGADVLNADGATLNIYEGEVRFESRGLLNGTGASTGINLDGLTVNISYNRNPYDNVDPLNGSRTTTDLFGVNINQSATQGNSISNARFSVGSYWGASVANTGTLAEQTKETLTFNAMTFNLNNGVFQREGNGEAGRTFDHIFNNVTINLVGGGFAPDDFGTGNLFDIQGGSGVYNSTTGTFDHPGVTEINGVFDNTSSGNNGTGFAVRGSRELRLTGNSTGFDGDVLVKQSTGRWISNSFDRSNGGQAASVYFNMSLAGANGSLNQANSITITRWGSVALLNNSANPVYASVNNDDRINDTGFTNFRNGYLLLETDVTTKNQENLGNIVSDYGTNYIYLDTRAGGQFDGAFQSLTLNNGSVLKIYDTNPSHTFGIGAGDDRIELLNSAGLVTVGADAVGTDTQKIVVGVFGGVLPTLATPTISTHTRPLESVQGSFMFSGGGTGLMTLDNGYLRPLTASEYNVGMTPVAGTNWLVNGYISPTGGNFSDRNNYAGRNVTSDVAVNSLTISFDAGTSGQAVPTAAKDYIIIENGKTLTVNSGVINFISFVEANSANVEALIRGGNLDMNGGPAVINASTVWHDLDRDTPNWYEVITGNSSYIRSHLINTTDLTKSGRNNLYLDTWNDISGTIYISEQGSIIARHNRALGAGGPGREVQIGGGSAFLLEYGTNISGINLRVSNTTQSSVTALRNEGTTHSTWGGDIILDVADGTGSSEFQSYVVTARANGTLSVYGNIYTDHNENFSDSDSFVDPPIVSTSFGETYTVNLRGQFRDVATGNLATDPLNAAITSVYRTGDSATRLDTNHALRFQMTGHDEGNVNVFQQWDATGRIDMRQGYFRILYDPLTAAGSGGFYTDGARALITPNDYFTRAVLGADGTSTTNAYHSHLMLTKDGQVFNAPYLYAYNDNRNGTLTIGGENESGTVYFGSMTNNQNFSLQFVNQTAERDVRFLQVRGGTMVWNGRLDDENSTVQSFNSSVSIVGPGTVIFNRNNVGNSDIDRWNFMAGEAHWGEMTGNDQFASNSTQALAGQSSWGGGGLVLDAQGTARSQQLNSHIWLFNGSSFVNTQNNTTLTLGNAAANLTRKAGSSLAFLEDGNGAVNISATGLSTTDGDFLGSWAVYGSAAGGVTDWAARQGTTGVQALTAYTSDAFGAGLHTNLTTGIALGADTNTATVRFEGAGALNLGGHTLTVDEGGILVPATNAGAVSITNGTLTSGWTGGSNDLMLHHYGTGIASVSAVIADNAGKVNLVNAGDGTTVLTGSNTYTGDTYLNGGVVQISSDANLGLVNGSIVQLIRVSNGGNSSSSSSAAYTSQTGTSIIFDTQVAPAVAATGTFNSSSTVVTSTTLTSGGSGYSSGIWVNLEDASRTTENKAGMWAILDSGNLHFDGGTLHVTETMELNGARTIFLGGNGGTLMVDAGKNLTINGYISSEFNHVTTANGFTNSNQIGADFRPASDRNPDIGDLIITGGGTVTLTGAPNGTAQANMYNSYGGITWVNEGILRIASAGSSASDGILGTNRSWIDGTIIGDQGTLLLNTTSDPLIREWMTFRGRGYEGRGTVQTVGTARTYRLSGQLYIEEDMFIKNRNGSNVRFNEGGGTIYGDGDIFRTGNGTLQIYGNAPDWTGGIYNGSGDFYMTSASNLQGMSSLTLERNTILYYDAGSTSIDEMRDRFSDTLPIFTEGYIRMRLRPNAGVYSGEEDAGVLTVRGGVLGLEFDLGTDVVNGALRQQGDYGLWHFDEIVRTPGSVVHLRSLDPGTEFASADFGVSQWGDVAGVAVDTAPPTVGTGDGSNGNTSIAPGFFGGSRPEFFNTTTGVIWDEDRTSRYLVTVEQGINPVTGATVNYLRPLSDAPGSTDYKIISDPGNTSGTVPVDLASSGIAADQNLRIVGIEADVIGSGFTSRINSALQLDSALEVNSVSFGAHTVVNNTSNAGNDIYLYLGREGNIKINSGVLMFANSGVMDRAGGGSDTNRNVSMNNFIQGGVLDFNGREAIIYSGSEWTQYNTSDQLNAHRNTDGDNTTGVLRTSIMNTGGFGLTKTGASSVTLDGANYYTGDTRVTQGNLYARHNLALGQSTRMEVTGAGNFIIGNSARIFGVDLYVGKLNGSNLALYAEGEGAQWGGNVIIDNVDSTGTAGGYVRSFVPRVQIGSSNTVFFIDGDIFGGDTPIAPGAQGSDPRIFTTYTAATNSTLILRGQVSDKSTGALTPAGSVNDSLRMEVSGTTDLATVNLLQSYDATGRIQLVRGVLRYMGDGNFYTDAAALAINPDNDMSGLQMGGRSIIDSNVGIGAQDVALFMRNGGSTFNLSSWNVGVDTTDPENLTGNSNYGLGNTTGNTTIGGENTTGTITFGTGTGSIRYTQATTLYDRNISLYAARGGTVDMRVNFVDGGDFVNSSITKIGAGTMNLLGSSAGDSTVEALKMLGGTLVLTGYDVNASRRVGNGAALTLSGGYLIVDALAGTAQEDFGDLTLNSGGSRLAVRGNATVNINSSLTLNPASGVTMAFIEDSGGQINISAPGLTTTDGERFGYWAVYGNVLGQVTDWAARQGTTGVQAFTGYDLNAFSSGNNTNVTTGGTFGSDTVTNSIRFGAAATLNLGGNTLTVENGGMLVSHDAGGPVSITNGTLTRAGAGDILLHNYGTATISANITDGGGKVNLVTGGTGTTILSGSNTYTGDTYVNGGVLQISSESQLGAINGSIARLVRENSGNNSGASGNLTFIGGGSGSGATGTFTASSNVVTSTTLTNGGSGYDSGVYVNTLAAGTGNAGIWAIFDSGNLHLDGGTLAVTDDITLNGARTIFLGASGGTFDLAAGKTLTINGYITSDVTDLPANDLPVDATRPYIGGLVVEGGGTLVLTGAPDNVIRSNMYNGYNALTMINNGTIQISSAGSSATSILGTYGGWVDSTYIGPNGTLLLSATSDPTIYEWLTLDGQGYQGGGVIQSNSTARSNYLRGHTEFRSDAVFNLRNGSNLYLNNGGGDAFGSGDIIRIGNGEFRFYGNIPGWTGDFIATSGLNRVYGVAGHVQGMGKLVLERNAYFGLEASSTSVDEFSDRLRDDMPVFADGYTRMRLEASGGVFSGFERVGVATVNAGVFGIEFDLGATLVGGAPKLVNDFAGWQFSEIVRTQGSSVHLRLFDSGTLFADSTFSPFLNSGSNRAVVQVDVMPALVGTGDGSNGNAAIVPGFFGGVRPAWVNGSGTGNIFNEDYTASRLVTVDTDLSGNHYLRPLLDSEYKIIANPDTAQTTSIYWGDQGINADQNLKLVGVITDTGIGAGEFTNRRNSILTLGSSDSPESAEVNSLTFASETFADGVNGRGNWTTLMLGDGDVLTIKSGVIQMANFGVQNRNGAAYDANQNLDIRSSLNGGSVNFDGQEAHFYLGSLWVHYNTSDSLNAYRTTDGDNNYFFMNSSIMNANGLTKTGSSSLFLQAPNYYTGPTNVNLGTLYARHDKALGATTQVNVMAGGGFAIGLGSRIAGIDLYIGKINGTNTALQIENNSVWAGNVIVDNVDSAGATSYARTFTPRVFSNTTGLATLEGNIYGGSTPVGSGALTDSRMFSTYTGAFGLFNITGQVRDSVSGALTGPVDIYNQSQVLRMEVTATNNESAVQLNQQHDAAGRIRIIRGSLYYGGTGNFYTDDAAATVNSAATNPMIGLQMGGRDILSGNGTGAANLGFFLLNGGSNFNLKSWEVGVETYDPSNSTGNGNYGLGNTTGNTTMGGVNISGMVTFGTGDGSVFITQGTATYTRDVGLFAARGGEVSFRVNFVDGGNLVTSSITKLGAGQVNLMGSSAGDSTVESVNVMGGILNMTDYGTNLNRRVGNGAGLTLAGGTLVMDGSGATFTENFGSLKLNQGGNAIAAAGNGVSSFGTVSIAGSSITRAAAGTVHFQSIGGGVVNFSNAAMKNVTRIGSYATFGANAAFEPFATDWAATDASGNVVAFTGYDASNVDVTGTIAGGAVNSLRFNTTAGEITSGSITLADGGILITSNHTGGTIIGAGVGVTTGGAGTDLIIHNFATGAVSFDGSITGAQNVVVAGSGELSFVAGSSAAETILSSTTSTNSYNVTLADTTGLVAGMDVTGMNIAAGTKIVSIVDGTTLTLSRMVTGSGTVDLTYSNTTYDVTNTFTGGLHVVGDSTVSFNNLGAFGTASGIFLNGGTLNYSETGAFSAYLTQNIVLGGGNGTLSVTDPGSTFIIRGTAANQISSEANNIISAYGTNNPNAGGLTIVGSGTVQFGDRSAVNGATQDLLGVVNNYTGLTIIGDGVNAIRVDIQGQGNDNAQYSIFGTTESWADATIVRNNAIIEFSMKRGDGSRDGQIRFREWFQIGEQAGDQILFDGSTQRQPTFDGILNIIGDLTFQTQGNRYGDAGSTGNSEFLINPNEGGVMGTGDIIKLGDGNLRIYRPLHTWTGDFDIQDGFVGMQMNSGALFNPNGVVYFGDPTLAQTSTIQLRIENAFFGNSTTSIDSPEIDLTFNRDIIIRDNIKQEVRIAAGYFPASSVVHFTNSIYVGSGSSAGVPVRFYYEDTTNLDPNLVGHLQHAIFDISGNITGSNNIWVDANEGGSANDDNNIDFTIWLRGDNLAWTGTLTIGADAGTTLDEDDAQIVRLGTLTALGTNTVNFRNNSRLQIGGLSRTFTQDFLFTGGAGMAPSSRIENGSNIAATITFDSGTQSGPNYQDIGVGLSDGVAGAYFGGGSSPLTVVKTGAGETVFGASTGGNDVVDAFSNYTGNTLVQEGTLYAGSNNSFSPYSRFIVSDGAKLSPYWDNAGTGWIVTIGSLSGTSGALVNIDNSTLSIGGDNTHDAEFSGVISGAGSLFKVGSGTQTLSGVNTFAGNLGVVMGTLVITNNTALGDPGNTMYLGGSPFVSVNPIDAKVEFLLSGTANAVLNPVSMNNVDGNDEGITVIGTRETSGTYGFDATASMLLYQDMSNNVFVEADGSSILQFNGAINDISFGTTPLRKIGTGTVEFHSSNTYAAGAGSAGLAIDGGTIIRSGTLSVFDSNALSSTAVELGDTRHTLGSDAYLATTKSLISSASSSFDPAGDGAGGAGNGAFLNVGSVVDGVTLTTADIGKRILVKDEGDHPERNGVYVVVSVNESQSVMNLVRAADFDESSEMLYGTSIAVTGGVTQAGGRFFMASTDISTVNGDDTDPVHWLADVANPDVALIAAAPDLMIFNDIDINDTNGAGSVILGGSFTSGYSYFVGNITLQHSSIAGVDNVAEVTVTSSSNDDAGAGEKGVIFTGVISESDFGDTLGIKKVGPGTVTFTNTNTYTGKTTVAEGTLALSGAGSIASTSWIEVNNGATFDFDATDADLVFDQTFSGSGTVVTDPAMSLIIGSDGGLGQLRPGMSSAPGNIATAGDQIGVLTVNGNLVLTGDATGATRLTLQMGATGGADYNDAAGISASLGAGTFNSYVASQAAFYDSQTGGNHDRVNVSGSFSMDSGGIIRFTSTGSDYQPVMGDVFNLIDWTSVTSNGFDVGNSGSFRSGGLLGDLELPDLSLSGFVFDTSLFLSHGIIIVVPEPGRMSLLFGGLMLLFLRRRRR
ncbi:MAG: autotransporter-associated beta strand repeat-containing protein [Prosthecobacter sp.]|jgi:autotransporter-associated beta strand protein|uniref:beta strand repeat-containing protein n=1 Tax=Prosthecobacter sp. TaxID=1965333 RepID=UPI001A0453F5|nr:autotransporter-associated beta strand repeat-containing protein [Prosthecobacter sp.]MBE2284104.1 autotransporter-associated beta strand repeat-containing protein [Prosthecobacter sp.]